jgi:hypothetical protein
VAFKGGLKDGARAITEKLRFWLKFGWTAVVRAGVPGTPSVYRRGLKWREFAGQFEGNAQRATEETRTEHGRNTDKPSAVHGKPLTPALSPKRGEGEECGARKKKRQARAPLGVCRYCGKGLFQQRSLDKGHCSNSKCVRQAQEVPSEGRGSNGFTPRGIEALPTGGNYTPKGKTSALAEAVLALFSREKAPVGVLEIEEQIKTAHPELMQTQQHATNLRVCLIDLSNAGKLVRLGHGAGAFYRASVEVADEESHG